MQEMSYETQKAASISSKFAYNRLPAFITEWKLETSCSIIPNARRK